MPHYAPGSARQRDPGKPAALACDSSSARDPLGHSLPLPESEASHSLAHKFAPACVPLSFCHCRFLPLEQPPCRDKEREMHPPPHAPVGSCERTLLCEWGTFYANVQLREPE